MFLFIKNSKKNYKIVVYYRFNNRKNTNVTNVVQALITNIIFLMIIIIKNGVNNYKVVVCYSLCFTKHPNVILMFFRL